MPSLIFLLNAQNSPVKDILLPTLILGGTALILGAIMVIVARAFAIKHDQLKEDVQSMLPQANCGACGFAGCEGYAVYLAGGGSDLTKCTVGGPSLAKDLSGVLGVDAGDAEEVVAHIKCKGDKSCTTERFTYNGTQTCVSANNLYGGNLSCTYGCLGFGDCIKACPYDAIDMRNGIAVINDFKCKACKICVPVCPKAIIEMVPKFNNNYKVECSSHAVGGETRKNCTVGCIACQRCYKACEFGAITMDNNLAIIDPHKCTDCNKCYEVCPTHSIADAREIYGHV